MSRLQRALFHFLPMLLGVILIGCGNTPAVAPVPVVVDQTQDEKALGYPDSRKIVRNSRGELFIAYRKQHTMTSKEFYHIFVAKSSDNGGSWVVLNGNKPIETVGDFQQRVPSIAVDANDVLHVVWYGNDADNPGENERQVKYVRSTDGGTTWSAWKNIAPVTGYEEEDLWQEHPAIAVGADNRVYVVWQGKEPEFSASQTKFTSSADGGVTWSPWININPSSENRSRPTIAPGTDGTLHVLAYGGTSDTQQVTWSRSTDDGRSWTDWALIAASEQDQRHVSVVIDRQNQLHAMWRQEPEDATSNAEPQIHYAYYNGSDWSAATVVGSADERYQFFPSITIDAEDMLWAVWTETSDSEDYPSENPTSGQIVYVRKQPEGSWSKPATLTDDSKHVFASLRADRQSGEAIDVVWLNNTSDTKKDIMYSRLVPQ